MEKVLPVCKWSSCGTPVWTALGFLPLILVERGNFLSRLDPDSWECKLKKALVDTLTGTRARSVDPKAS
uniref:Uncharacterized protein n=1 Tax=Anguilla anguilla TaxID=7936 RepID=A0A0E9TIZ3_ANGAN